MSTRPASGSSPRELEPHRLLTKPVRSSVFRYRLLEEHGRLRNTIATAPVDALEREGRSLLQRMRLGPAHGDASAEGGGGGSHGSWLSGGADFQSVAPKVSSLLDRLQTARSHLLQSWNDKKLHLDQALQLHLFEQDATKVRQSERNTHLCARKR